MLNKSLNKSLIIFLFTIILVFLISKRSNPVVIEKNLRNLPLELSGFKGIEDKFPDSIYEELDADEHVYRHYTKKDGKQVDLYIGYYGTAKGGRSNHSPSACLPGAGWGIVKSDRIKVIIEGYPKSINLNCILARKGDMYFTVLHWYQSLGNKILTTGIDKNVERFLGKMIYNRSDGAFIRVSVFSRLDGIDEAREMAKSFSERLLPILPKYWPIEK